MNVGQNRPQSLHEAFISLATFVVMIWLIVSCATMARRRAWLTYAVVTPAPIQQNTRLDANRLSYRFRRVDRATAPVGTIAEAQGQFVTRSAAERCKAPCTELVVTRDDRAPRPEPQSEMFKATIAPPWRSDDFRVGDDVYVSTPRDDAPTSPSRAPDNNSGLVVPRAGADPVPPAPNVTAGRGAAGADRVQLWAMKVVAIGADSSSSVLYLEPPKDTAETTLSALRRSGLQVSSIKPPTP